MSRVVRRGYAHPFRAGLITIVVLAVGVFIGFSKDNPFARPFHLGVVVADSSSVKPGTAVRIAGVNVGIVSSVERYDGGKAALVNMDINKNGLPVREGATVRIRPRLFLEGNLMLDLSPGAPGAKRLKDGDVIPITHSSRSVQLDQVFSTLQAPERKDLQVVVQQLGKALGTADPADTDPLTKGQSAGQSFNDTIAAMADGGTDIEQLFRALQGEDRGDLASAIRALAAATGPLADRADDLGRLIDGLDSTVAVFADNSTAVRAGITQLPKTVDTAQRELPVIRKSLEPTRQVAKNVADSLDRLPALVDAANPFLDQTKLLLSAKEAGGLVKTLEPITAGLAKAAPGLTSTLQDLDRLSVCASKVLVPTANQVIQDGRYTTGLTVWDEFLRSTVGLASSSQNFDANGPYARATAAEGSIFTTGSRLRNPKKAETADYFGVSNSATASTRPAKPANTLMTSTTSPWKFDVSCATQTAPNLSAVPSGPADGQGG